MITHGINLHNRFSYFYGPLRRMGEKPLTFVKDFSIDKMCSAIVKVSHSVYDLKYQVVWITKYRKSILPGQVAEKVREIIREICPANGGMSKF